MQFSEEQEKIAVKASQDYNLIIDAVAGSGKTTTIIHIGQRLSDKKILALLYNRQLADESQEKINGVVDNVTIKTIHSFAQWFYSQPCFSDEGLDAIVYFNKPPAKSTSYDMVIIDEAQDIYPLTAKIIRKILRDLQEPQRIFMGDYRQCINQFRESDSRYLLNADDIFLDPTREWRRLTLSKTFRCTESMVKFVNYCLKDSDHMVAARSSGDIDITYWLGDIYNNVFQQNLIDEVKAYLSNGYRNDDIAFISYSLKTFKNPISRIANKLSKSGVLIYKPLTDDSDIKDSRLTEGKVVFSTIHQFKGRQRKIIFFVNFDDSLYKYYNGNGVDRVNICPNRVYVGLTRATDHLHLLHHHTNNYFSFVREDELSKYVNLKKLGDIDTSDNQPYQPKTNFSVTDIIKHLPYRLIKRLKCFYRLSPSYKIGVHNVTLEKMIKFKYKETVTYEDVSAIYGTMIPYIKWDLPKEQSEIIKFLDNLHKRPDEVDHFNLLSYVGKKKLEKIAMLLEKIGSGSINVLKLPEIAFLVNAYNCFQDGYIFALKQIRSYEFCQSKQSLRGIKKILDNMNIIDRNDYEFEKKQWYFTRMNDLLVKISGAFDAFSSEILWEFKCVNQLTDTHALQLLVYACMDYHSTKKLRQYKLYNIQTGKVRDLTLNDPDKASEILKIIITNRLEFSENKKSLDKLIEELEI